jgi:hypothetical protein
MYQYLPLRAVTELNTNLLGPCRTTVPGIYKEVVRPLRIMAGHSW